MKIPEFWGHAVLEAKKPDGTTVPLGKWHWSDVSVADAEERAREKLRAIASRVAAGEPFPARYAYASDQPLREEVIREVQTDVAKAVITRNAYGALVLNADNLMFVDIDFPEPDYAPRQQTPGPDLGKMVKSWLGKLMGGGVETVPTLPERAQTAQIASPADEAVRQVERWAANNHEWLFRIYRTFSGLRLIATSGLFTPDDPENLRKMQELNCDPLYLKLCKSQKSYRARLTPKPWRIGFYPPAVKWPYTSEQRKSMMQDWVIEYEKRSAKYATCKFLKSVGNAHADARIAPVVVVHDEITRAMSDLPLA